MDRKTFLRILDQSLAELVPAQEREEMIRYYEEYFADADPDGESSVAERLGDPREIAKQLAAEAGFSAANPVGKKRRVWPWIVLAATVVFALVIGWYAWTRSNGPGNGKDQIPGTTQPGVTESPSQSGNTEGEGHISAVCTPFKRISVEAAIANVSIAVGDSYSVELIWDSEEDYSLDYSLLEGELKVIGSTITTTNVGVEKAEIVIIVPSNEVLTDFDVNVGIGGLEWEGSGCVDAEVELGMGSIVWSGVLANDMELNTGMGDIKVISEEEWTGWDIELNTGMGDIAINGKTEGIRYTQKGSLGSLIAQTGMGDIVLNSRR